MFCAVSPLVCENQFEGDYYDHDDGGTLSCPIILQAVTMLIAAYNQPLKR